MIKIANNYEIYSNQHTDHCTILHRGTGSVSEFSCDEHGKQFLTSLKLGIIPQSGFITETLLELGVLVHSNAISDFTSYDQALWDMGLIPSQAISKLKKSIITIIGLGTTGGWIAQQLSAFGVGEFILIDNDVVSESNLTRQPYRFEDLGKKKIHAIQSWFNPNQIIHPIDAFINNESDIPEIVKKSQIVLGKSKDFRKNIYNSWNRLVSGPPLLIVFSKFELPFYYCYQCNDICPIGTCGLDSSAAKARKTG